MPKWPECNEGHKVTCGITPHLPKVLLLTLPLGSVFCLQLFLLYTAELFSLVEYQLYDYADDYTLVAVVPSPADRVAVTESMNRDLNRDCVCCDVPGMKLNVSKTKTMIVSRSCTVHPQLTLLTLDGQCRRNLLTLSYLGCRLILI